MERYFSYGGKSNPEFRYRVRIKETTDQMMHWCSVYPANGSFERYYIEWHPGPQGKTSPNDSVCGAVFQFETERPALLFKLKFGDQ
jgi:hypothetical protein